MANEALTRALLYAAQSLHKLKLGQSHLSGVRNSSTRIDSKNGKVDSLTHSEDVGLSIQILQNQRLGFSYTTSLEQTAIDRALEVAFQVSTLMSPDKNNSLGSFQGRKYEPLNQLLDRDGLETPLKDKISLAHELEFQCRLTDPRITAMRSASLSEYFSEVVMIDQEGVQLHHKSSLFTASITCKAEEKGDSQVGNEFRFSRTLKDLDIEGTAQMAARLATEQLHATLPTTGKYPALFRNNVVTELLEFLSTSFSAEEIDKGKSIVAGRLGESLFSQQITIYNDGLLTGGFTTAPFDGEGMPCRTTTLVEDGVFKEALYDLFYARKHGKESSGSAQRSIKSPPKIGISNFYLKNGDRPVETLWDEIERGILITDLMGVHTANPVTGDFSVGASGILIENGKLTKPLRGFAVAGNVLELFRQVSGVANDLKFFGNVGAPSVSVREISIGGH